MKKSGLLQRQEQMLNRREIEVRRHTQRFMLDLVILTLGRMGFREKRLTQFRDTFDQVAEEYAKLLTSDAKDDPELVYSKECIDREMRQYVGPGFVTYEERYQ